MQTEYPTTEYPTTALGQADRKVGNMAPVPDVPMAYQLLNEMRKQNSWLEEQVNRMAVVWSRTSGGGEDPSGAEKSRPCRSGLVGEMQDVIDLRAELQERLDRLIVNMNGVV